VKPPFITLTTDFGAFSPYVAAMKGVILTINPAAVVVDLCHTVEHQNVQQGAFVLNDTAPWFPPGTLHVAVVDPGVGTSRRIIYARIGDHAYLGPDNGLFSRLAHQTLPTTIIAVTESAHWLAKVSNTFHGRDIMAAVAARLSLGLDPHRLGPIVEQMVMLPWPEVVVSERKIAGRIQSIDSFGNLITDINEALLANVPRGESTLICCDEHETRGIFATYGDQPEMTLIALVGSRGNLELAIVGESAAMMLGVRTGTPVTVSW
jgi:S-adenosylmethionine hydrolase